MANAWELRTANKDDLDDMTAIMCAAFPEDPQWDYRFPHRQDYPDEHYNCTRAMMKQLLHDHSDDSHTLIKVIVAPRREKEGEPAKAVALAVWQLQFKPPGPATITTRPVTPPANRVCGDNKRRDADATRMHAFDATLAQAKTACFDQSYGAQQLHLLILATHPNYQRQGAGARHCRWGIEQAGKHRLALTVFSSPMGAKLYTHLEFARLGDVIVQVEGEKEKLTIGVMVYDRGFHSSSCSIATQDCRCAEIAIQNVPSQLRQAG